MPDLNDNETFQALFAAENFNAPGMILGFDQTLNQVRIIQAGDPLAGYLDAVIDRSAAVAGDASNLVVYGRHTLIIRDGETALPGERIFVFDPSTFTHDPSLGLGNFLGILHEPWLGKPGFHWFQMRPAWSRNFSPSVIGSFLPDVSTVSSAYVRSSVAGVISQINIAAYEILATSDAVISFAINGTPIVGGDITIAQGGSPGVGQFSNPTADNVVVIGDIISMTSDGASTNTSPAMAHYLIVN